jgi:hypothetical protein
MRRMLPVAVLMLLVAAAVLLWRQGPGAPPAAPAERARPGDAPTSIATAGAGATGPASPPEPSPLQREAEPPPPEGPLMRGRVTGLLFGVPWTQPIQFEFEGHDMERGGVQHHRERFVPEGDGAFALRLPAWVATSTVVVASFAGDDPLYRRIQVDLRAPAFAESRLAAAAVIELPTEARALVRGTVGLANGNWLPQPATVSAYLLRDGLPEQARVAVTTASSLGKYELQVPVAGDLVVIAVAMEESRLLGPSLTTRDSSLLASGTRFAARQPAAAVLSVRLGAVTDAPRLGLADSARLEVTVTSAAGRAARVPLALTYAADKILDYGVCWWRDGGCAAGSPAMTDDQGRAVLLGADGRLARLAYDWGSTDVAPPCRRTLTLPPR